MKILIKYATRGRRNLFQEALLNIYTTIGTNDYEIIVSADKDDADMRNPILGPNTRVYYGEPSNKIEAINRDMDKAGDWDLLIAMSDDMYWISSDWAPVMISLIKQKCGDSLDFFAHFNDGYTGDKLPTMSIMGRDYYLRDNYIYHPAYKAFSCDSEQFFIAKLRARWYYFPNKLFEHRHPSNLSTSADNTYALSSKYGAGDIATYKKRRKFLFA